MSLFKPKVYKSDGLDAYHLINDDGGDFLYEGSVEYSEEELFRDDQGRTFYLVTTEIGGPNKYYIEVEAEFKSIPAGGGKKEKDISGLVNASPKDGFAEGVAPVESGREEEPSGPAAPQPDTCFEGPERADEPAEPEPVEATPQAAVKAMASLGERRPHKKRSVFRLPVVLALLFIIIIIAAAGIVIFKPGLIPGLNSAAQPTITPTFDPTLNTPTPEPTATPQPTPVLEPGSRADLTNRLFPLVLAFNSNNTSVMAFVNDTVNPMGISDTKLARVCDLFDRVNENWSVRGYSGTPQLVNESIQTMSGSNVDYSILMADLAAAEGMDSRVVIVYDKNNKTYVYYPEIKVATNYSGFIDATNYLRGRYDVTDPYYHLDRHLDRTDYWLSFARGKEPGRLLYEDPLYDYAVYSGGDMQAL